MRNIKLSHKLSQKLLITPNLRQALRLLQLPYPILKNYIEQQIAENPLLQPPNEEPLEIKINRLLASSKSYSHYSQKQSIINASERLQPVEKQKPQNISLQDFLLRQLRMTFLTDAELSIAYELITYIDSNGYLRIDLDKFVKEHNLSLDKTVNVLKVIQELEPSGVGAKNLQECLLIQLKNKEQEDSLAYKIVQSYFKELSKKKYDLIAKNLNASLVTIKEAAKSIISLNPKPGATFLRDENISITPDITVESNKGKLKVTLSEKELPMFKINNQYRKLLKDPDTSEEIRRFIKERLKEAVWLISAVEQRQKNVRKVIQAILETQKQAILTSLYNIKPLTLKDIAKNTGLHLSTIGRIVANKYISTPQGTIRLKNLFSTKFKSNNGIIYSDKNILSKIQRIINAEDKEKPLIDQVICNILRRGGIQISRRTVTKYRNKLKMPPSFLR